MAKTLYSQSGKIEYGIKKYTVDTEADKEALNLRTTKMGSKCYVMDTKKWYILNSSNQWIPFVGEGGSGRSPFNIKGSVATVNDLPTEDNEIGDLYAVQEDHSEWVWLTNSENPEGYWEKLGIEITADAVASAIGDMTSTQTVQTRSNLGAEPEKFMIIVTYDDVNDEYTADKTYIEMSDAYDNGRTLTVLFQDSVLNLIYYDGAKFFFARTVVLGDETYQYQFNCNDDGAEGEWEYHSVRLSTALFVTSVTGTTPTITPAANTIYNCGELTSLTISNPPATGAYSIVFTSGSTATTTTIPATILGLEDFAAEANTIYEINILDNRAVVGSWAVSA